MLQHPPSVLVVEDDKEVRDIVVGLLRGEGFDVRGTRSGWTALGMIKRKKFDLMIADIELPGGLDGLELVKCARAARPILKCLFISGRARAVVDDPERDDFVGKPFRQRELLGCVWELLYRRVPADSIGWELRQAERSRLAAEVDCRRKKLLEQKRARRGDRV